MNQETIERIKERERARQQSEKDKEQIKMDITEKSDSVFQSLENYLHNYRKFGIHTDDVGGMCGGRTRGKAWRQRSVVIPEVQERSNIRISHEVAEEKSTFTIGGETKVFLTAQEIDLSVLTKMIDSRIESLIDGRDIIDDLSAPSDETPNNTPKSRP